MRWRPLRSIDSCSFSPHFSLPFFVKKLSRGEVVEVSAAAASEVCGREVLASAGVASTAFDISEVNVGPGTDGITQSEEWEVVFE